MISSLLVTSFANKIEIAETRSSSIGLSMPGCKFWDHQAMT